jgi:hypothetical protein
MCRVTACWAYFVCLEWKSYPFAVDSEREKRARMDAQGSWYFPPDGDVGGTL